MRRIILLLFSTALLITGCSSARDVSSSFFIDTDAKKAIYSLAQNSEEYRRDVFKTEFLSEKLCYDVEEVATDSYTTDAVSAACYCVTDAKIVYSKNIYEKVYPASITKLLTALLALKYGNMDEEVIIQQDNCGITIQGAQLCRFMEGDKILLGDLLRCLLIYSGNDAAIAIACHISGSEEAFVKLMNEEAIGLCANNTHYVNSHGLHNDDHYTTAYDTYLIFNECLKYEAFMEVIKQKKCDVIFSDKDGLEKQLHMEATNLFYTGLKQAPEGITVLGGKTGVTLMAGNCLIICYENSNKKLYIAEVFKAETKDKLYESICELMELE